MALQTLEKPVADRSMQKGALYGRSADAFSDRQPETSTARVKQAELVLFTTQLSVMLDSGVWPADATGNISGCH
ncbi:MAG: hypothetical protein ACYSUZ_08080 [Planctomycetota bacterium]|jgi:type II secretory pathway component PulF